MVNWIRDYSNVYRSKTGRYPVIHTSTNWWKTCTNDSPAFGSSNPLWVTRYASSVGPLPSGWRSYTFWQYSNHGSAPGNQDYYNGNADALKQ